MKRLTALLLLLLIPLLMSPVHALAAETEKLPSHVTITVVMPESTTPPETKPEPEPTPTIPDAPKLYPTGILETQENGRREIIKTYELSPGENPADIPRDSFEREGWSYFLTDITKKETAAADIREHLEIVTLNTDTKEMEAILRQLAPTLEFVSEDGYTGILALDVASIKVETAGTKTTSYEMKVTREYPHLSTNDTELVPKTVTENGKTYKLAGVEWKVGNYSTVDYEKIPDYYTAVATYTATGSSTKVTGYNTTAEYKGSVSKLNQGRTIYTAYFLGAEILPERTPLEIIEPTPSPETAKGTETKTELDADPTEQPAETETPSETEAPEEPADGADKDANPWPLIILGGLLVLLLGMGAGFYIPRLIKNTKSKGESDK